MRHDGGNPVFLYSDELNAHVDIPFCIFFSFELLFTTACVTIWHDTYKMYKHKASKA